MIKEDVLLLHICSSRVASADGGSSEPASTGPAGAQHPAEPNEDLPGWNWLTPAGPTVVPAAVSSGPGGESTTAKRNGQHAGTVDANVVHFSSRFYICQTKVDMTLFSARLDRWLRLALWNIWSLRMWLCPINSQRPNTAPSKKKNVLLFSCRALRYTLQHPFPLSLYSHLVKHP